MLNRRSFFSRLAMLAPLPFLAKFVAPKDLAAAPAMFKSCNSAGGRELCQFTMRTAPQLGMSVQISRDYGTVFEGVVTEYSTDGSGPYRVTAESYGSLAYRRRQR